MNIGAIFRTELKLLLRNRFKIVAIVLFLAASVYALQTGYSLLKIHQSTIAEIEERKEKSIAQTVEWFDKEQYGPESRPWIDVRTPFWAIWNAPTWAIKEPSPMLTFGIGQAEQFAYYKNTTLWSTVFDKDLAEELANPERLAIGSLDYTFILIFLLPLLMIILLYDVGGLEKDLQFEPLIKVQSASLLPLLFVRFIFYFCLLSLLVLLPMLLYASVSGVWAGSATSFWTYYLLFAIYTFICLIIFLLINRYGKGRTDHAVKMLVVWLVFCVLVPASVHQWAGYRFPAADMTEFIDTQRDDSRSIAAFGIDSMANALIFYYPELQQTAHAQVSTWDQQKVYSGGSAFANKFIKPKANAIINEFEQKNRYIESTYWFNPISWLQNRFNAICETDYYAYDRFRMSIQAIIDAKTSRMIYDVWDDVSVDKEGYLEYVNTFNNE
jgi:ABC-2 type transport system permease protein